MARWGLTFNGGNFLVSWVVRRSRGRTSVMRLPAQPVDATVVPEDGLKLPCRVVRRTDFRIGVAFD
jgi:hypothetical protein